MSSSERNPFVRPYNASTDLDAVVRVFKSTIHPSVAFPAASHVGSYIWLRPYLSLPSASAFVLDDGQGKAVGYCIGVSDTKKLISEWREVYFPKLEATGELNKEGQGDTEQQQEKVKALLREVKNPEELEMKEWPNLINAYPSHLHINILPSHQRGGHGRTLISALLQDLKQRGCPGVFLGMAGDNDDAYAFYKKLDFSRFDEVMDGGKSGEKGRTAGSGGDDAGAVWLVKKL